MRLVWRVFEPLLIVDAIANVEDYKKFEFDKNEAYDPQSRYEPLWE